MMPTAPARLLLPAHVVEERRAERAEQAAGRQLMAFQRAARSRTGVFIPNTGQLTRCVHKPATVQHAAGSDRLDSLLIGGPARPAAQPPDEAHGRRLPAADHEDEAGRASAASVTEA